jgi:CRP-like cAMP-binding protein
MSSDDQLARLRRLPVFATLDDNVLERVLAVSSELECPPGYVFIRADDPGAGMFVLEEGTVAVEVPGKTIELGPGEFFGELSLLVPESTRVARVRATTAVRCVAISRAAFEELIEGEPAFTLAMLHVVARRLWHVMHGD